MEHFASTHLRSAYTYIILSLAADCDEGGPVAAELVRVLDHCDLSNSRLTTPSISPSSSSLIVSSPTPPSQQQQQQTPKRLHTVALATTGAVQSSQNPVTVSLPVSLADTASGPTSPRTSKI